MGSGKFKKCDFVVGSNNKIGIITKVKRQKSFDFLTVQFPFGTRGVPEDFLKKIAKSSIRKNELDAILETPVKGCKK